MIEGSGRPEQWLHKDVAKLKEITSESPLKTLAHKVRRQLKVLGNFTHLELPKTKKATVADLSNETLRRMHEQDFPNFPRLTDEQINQYKGYIKKFGKIPHKVINENLWIRQIDGYRFPASAKDPRNFINKEVKSRRKVKR